MRWVFLLLVGLPVLDLWLLVRLAGTIGAWPTVGLLAVAGLTGLWAARVEGVRVLREWMAAVQAGRRPPEGVQSGLLVLLGAFLLILPGVVSDVLGLLLVFPPTRRLAGRAMARWVERQVAAGRVRVLRVGAPPFHDGPGPELDVTPPRPAPPRALPPDEGGG